MKLFKTVKKIVSKEGVLHFKRFAVVECKWFNIYIHTILKADEDPHLHDHPWDYVSLVLKGSFLEGSVDKNKDSVMTALVRGSISMQKAERFHKIVMLSLASKMVKTLFFTGPRRREWGYDVDGTWIHNEIYRQNKRKGLYK